MKIKVSEATTDQLDWMVAKCEGMTDYEWPLVWQNFRSECRYTTDWAQGGPIIERERISVISDYHEIKEGWLAENYEGTGKSFGSTTLIAAMRCYVTSRLGAEVEIPEELK